MEDGGWRMEGGVECVGWLLDDGGWRVEDRD